MTIDIEALEAAAKAATPGPWVRGRYGGVFPDHENARGPCVVHAQYADHTSRPNAEANEAFVAAANPKVVLSLLRRLRDAEGNHAASCIYCGEAVIYDTRKVDDIAAAHQLLMEHDRQCPKNPVAQERDVMAAYAESLRKAGNRAICYGGAESSDEWHRLLSERSEGAASIARMKAAMLLDLARDYRDMNVDTDVIENLRARAGMELSTVGIPLQVFEENQS